MSDSKKNTINQADEKLWENVTKKDIKYSKANRMVCNNKALVRKNTVKPKPLIKKAASENVKKQIETKIVLEEKNIIPKANLDPSETPTGISLNQAEKLKKGNIRPEKQIDLHGFTQVKANNYLKDKLTEFYKINIRCVLVITGKKLGKHGAEGVLRKEVPRWLNMPPLRQIILMTSWAHPKDGGDGALYILLKKRR